MNLLENRYFKKIPYFFLILLSLYPIMPEALFSITSILFLLTSLLVYKSNFIFNYNIYGAKPLIVNTGFYFLIIFSCLYSENWLQALSSLQPTILLLLFPFIIIYFFPPIEDSLFRLFSIGYIVSNVILFCYFFYILIDGMYIDRFPKLWDKNLFEKVKILWAYPYEFTISKSYKHLNVLYESHKVYLSLNFVLSILLATKIIAENKNYVIKVLLIFVASVLGVFIVYTQAIVVIFTLVLLLLVYPFVNFNKIVFKIVYLISLISCMLLLLNNNYFDSFKNKNSDSIELLIKYFETGELTKGIDTRAYIYDCSLRLIKNNFLTGYGVGDVQSKLNSCYQRNNYTVAVYNSLGKDINSHNYYFHLLLSGGFLCLSLFLYLLINNFYKASIKKNFTYLVFIIIISVNLFTENLLVRINGVAAFAIFNSLFYSNGFMQGEKELLITKKTR
ncbi:O-antigen ligase family protein [Galbibacter sp. BG1]